MSLSARVDGDVSLSHRGDALVSPGAALVVECGAERRCRWCRSPLEVTQEKWCSKRCRQTAYRFRRLAAVEDLADTPKRLCVADPPFPGMSRKYYRDEPTFAGEVDHARLLEQLTTGGYDGWALFTSPKALRDVLSLVPRGVEPRVCTWLKTHCQPKGRGIVCISESVIVVPARQRFPGVPDAIRTAVARGGDSSLMGRKPLKVVQWTFGLLGASHVDSLDDLFPGSGVFGRCFDELRRSAPSMTGGAS